MLLPRWARAAAAAACFFLSGAESAECASTQMDVNSTADAQTLVERLDCTGGGEFNVTWHGRVETYETLNVTEGVSLTITGAKSSNFSLDGHVHTAIIVGDKITSETGLFSVSGACTLTLNNLVLQGGHSITTFGAGAVEARGSEYVSGAFEPQGSAGADQTVNVIDCLFKDNNGTNSGM